MGTLMTSAGSPLNVLEMKPEVSAFAAEKPTRGISAHFMNVEFHVNMSKPEAFLMQKYNKRRALPFQYTQFIKFRSNQPIR